MKKAPPQALLKLWRDQIDETDRAIVALLSRRAKAVQAIGELKKRGRMPIRDRKREAAVLKNAIHHSKGPLDERTLLRIYSPLVKEFRRFEQERTQELARLGRGSGERRSLTVSIVGLGLLGGSLACALRRYAPEHRLIGYDKKGRKNQTAAELVDRLCGSELEALKADIVILAMPIEANLSFLRRHQGNFKRGVIITDVGSTKRQISKLAHEILPAGVEFVGAHPIAGKSSSGAENADPDLFVGRSYVIAIDSRASAKSILKVESLLRRIGAKVVRMDSKAHDHALAVTSHLPQMAAVALALTAAELGKSDAGGLEKVCGPGFRDMTRLAESPYEIWKDIARTNPDFIQKALRTYVKSIQRLSKAIPSGKFEGEFARARALIARLRARGALPC